MAAGSFNVHLLTLKNSWVSQDFRLEDADDCIYDYVENLRWRYIPRKVSYPKNQAFCWLVRVSLVIKTGVWEIVLWHL